MSTPNRVVVKPTFSDRTVRVSASIRTMNGSGGGDITVEALSVAENGTHTAPSGKAYSPVIVAVPQTTLEALSVTDNGVYTPVAGHAYSGVTVAIPSASGVSF